MSPRGRRRRWIAAGVAVVVVAAAVVAIVFWRTSGGSGGGTAGPSATSVTTPAPSAPASTVTAAPAVPPATSGSVPGFAYEPLWPFAGTAEAVAWQAEYRSGGHQPWHLDAALTAQSFTQDFLGYGGVDLVTRQSVQGREAWVGVGYRAPNGAAATAAVLHLAKLGPGVDAPWEVVGTRDSVLTITRPGYGAKVTSPVTVGGRITGVDENLVVRIRDLASGLVGQAPGVPAGGENTPWSVSVPFTAPAPGVLTIAVATGGHVTDVERFAVTGAVAG
ncbi:hypothetical protein FPZ12_017955 [Amycolatopsis acidicola]|uniref:Uncharacterized protein n=2 Tax=Amycolatopsis acidicola TaxID=2596893 RepID=A0A5N0V1L4_9PSEU|nr:hypothetical protein FPZ12_017955 [Amycolatopsis acidicola]